MSYYAPSIVAKEEVIAVIRHLGNQSVRSRRLSPGPINKTLPPFMTCDLALHLLFCVTLQRILLLLFLIFQEPADMRLIRTASSALKSMI
jgi:hypothetical protein